VLAVAPDIAYGEYLSAECTACHSGGDAGIPKIKGLEPELFVTAMVEYRTGERTHQVMEMVSGRLGDEEIVSLAMYFKEAE
jgi:cytochrome c